MTRHAHLSIHAVRTSEPVGLDEVAELGAAVRFHGVECDLRGDVGRPRVGVRWAAVAFHDDESSARDALDRPPLTVAADIDVAEEWHVAGAVVAHRGETDWLGDVGPMLEPSGAAAGEPVMVMTTAGYVIDETFDVERAGDFVNRVEDTRRHLASLPANSLALVLNSAPLGLDGITLSAWDDVASFVDAAYRTGPHAENLERHRNRPMFDRSSFTRIRPLDSRGSWDGGDPLRRSAADR